MFAHVEDGKVDYRGSLPKNWKNISGLDKSAKALEFLKTVGWLPYEEVTVALGDNEVLDGEEITISSDKVVSTQKKRSLSSEEIKVIDKSAWVDLRHERNIRLRETDHFALSDMTLSDEMKEYRKKLRDLPSEVSNPHSFSWPTNPSAESDEETKPPLVE